MKIQDLLRKDVMLLDLQATEKRAAIEEMIHSLVVDKYVSRCLDVGSTPTGSIL